MIVIAHNPYYHFHVLDKKAEAKTDVGGPRAHSQSTAELKFELTTVRR